MTPEERAALREKAESFRFDRMLHPDDVLDLLSTIDAQERELERLRQQIERVRELHTPMEQDGSTVCTHCYTFNREIGHVGWILWPCPTIVALSEGEEP